MQGDVSTNIVIHVIKNTLNPKGVTKVSAGRTNAANGSLGIPSSLSTVVYVPSDYYIHTVGLHEEMLSLAGQKGAARQVYVGNTGFQIQGANKLVILRELSGLPGLLLESE